MVKSLKTIELIFLAAVGLLFAVSVGKYFYGEALHALFATPVQALQLHVSYMQHRLKAPTPLLPSERGQAATVPVLLYHGVSARPYKDDIVQSRFAEHMYALKRAGYEAISLADFFQFLTGEKAVPEKSFLLTFDDGIKTSFYHTDPLLRALDYKAVMFIITKYSLADGSSYYLSFDEIQQMLQSGRWEIQSHGRDAHDLVPIDAHGRQGHFLSHKQWLADERRLETDQEYRSRITQELAMSKRDLEQTLHQEVIAFAFPFGDFGQTSANFPGAQQVIVETIGDIYSLANFYQFWPSRGFSQNDPSAGSFMVKRISVAPDWSGTDLLGVLERGQAKALPYLDTLTTNRGWVQTWGDLTVADDVLNMQASPSTTGSATFLDGSYLWKDYTFHADVHWQRGESLSLLARYRDGEHFVACTFTANRVRIEERVGGHDRVLAEGTLTLAPGSTVYPAIAVTGDAMACLLDDAVVLSARGVSATLPNGGIGFKTWDPIAHTSKMQVRNVSVGGEGLQMPHSTMK